MKHLLLPSLAALLLVATGCEKSLETQDAQREPEMLKSGKAVIWTKTVQLSGSEEVPAVNTSTTGVAILRLTADGTLHSKINVEYLEPGDALRFAHIHFGAKGVNGPIFVTLVPKADEFGKNRQQQLTEAQVEILLNDPLYVNVHSNFYPPGVIRGQIR